MGDSSISWKNNPPEIKLRPRFQDNFVVPKISLKSYPNSIFPPLKCSPFEEPVASHEFSREISNKDVTKTTTEDIVIQELGNTYYLLKETKRRTLRKQQK